MRARESEVIREQNKTCQFLRSHPCRPRSLTGDSSVMHRAIPSIAYVNGVSVDVKFRDLYGAEGDRHGNAALKPQAQAIAVVRRQRASPQTTTRSLAGSCNENTKMARVLRANGGAAAREQGKHVLHVRPIPRLVLVGDTGRPLRWRVGPERPPCRRPAAPRKAHGQTHGRAETHGRGSQKRKVAPAPLCVSYHTAKSARYSCVSYRAFYNIY
jgi:hypothetical protein